MSSFADLLGVSDASFVRTYPKDWGAMLGRNFIDNQDRMALEMRGERSIHRGGPMAEVVEVDDFSVQIKEYSRPARSSSSSSTNTWNTTSRLVAGSRESLRAGYLRCTKVRYTSNNPAR